MNFWLQIILIANVIGHSLHSKSNVTSLNGDGRFVKIRKNLTIWQKKIDENSKFDQNNGKFIKGDKNEFGMENKRNISPYKMLEEYQPRNRRQPPPSSANFNPNRRGLLLIDDSGDPRQMPDLGADDFFTNPQEWRAFRTNVRPPAYRSWASMPWTNALAWEEYNSRPQLPSYEHALLPPPPPYEEILAGPSRPRSPSPPPGPSSLSGAAGESGVRFRTNAPAMEPSSTQRQLLTGQPSGSGEVRFRNPADTARLRNVPSEGGVRFRNAPANAPMPLTAPIQPNLDPSLSTPFGGVRFRNPENIRPSTNRQNVIIGQLSEGEMANHRQPQSPSRQGIVLLRPSPNVQRGGRIQSTPSAPPPLPEYRAARRWGQNYSLRLAMGGNAPPSPPSPRRMGRGGMRKK